MTEHVQKLQDFFIGRKEHHAFRQSASDPLEPAYRWHRNGTTPLDRATERVCSVLEAEKPVVFPFERIALTRTVPTIPEIFTPEEMEHIREDHWIHETGDLNNVCPDYTLLMHRGIYPVLEELRSRTHHDDHDSSGAFVRAQVAVLSAMASLAERYSKAAEKAGRQETADVFSSILERPAGTLLEALQFFRLIHFCLWCANNYQVTVGRADQFLYPYYSADIASGRLTRESALELIEEFFLTFNRDSDLYPGVQRGDNGQTLVLGGRDLDGTDRYNELSDIMLDASLELRLIDPKINLRVDSRTPKERLEKATMLTRTGLGFPQYMNDDIIVPALIDWGYAPEDAENYAVAACWEPIIPGKGADVPNADGFPFPAVVRKTILDHLDESGSYDEFEAHVRQAVREEADRLVKRFRNLYMIPSPMLSLVMTGCMGTGADVLDAAVYRNIGFHGPGLSSAADALTNVRHFVYEEKLVSKEALTEALRTNFSEAEQLCASLRYDGPKMGNDVDEADAVGSRLLEWFADALSEHSVPGCTYRAGTASAMYYIWQGDDLGATADGRRAGEPLPCNYSPGLFTRTRGPVSTVKSFTKQNLRRTANGGPLTLELHDTVFRDPDSIGKVASLVKLFVDRGGHQLQINAVNADQMRQAQKTPEQYRNLIVRVWGWSGYFVELEPKYQEQIIQRTEFTL